MYGYDNCDLSKIRVSYTLPRPYYMTYWISLKYEHLRMKNSHQVQTYVKKGSCNSSAGVNIIPENREGGGKKPK